MIQVHSTAMTPMDTNNAAGAEGWRDSAESQDQQPQVAAVASADDGALVAVVEVDRCFGGRVADTEMADQGETGHADRDGCLG